MKAAIFNEFGGPEVFKITEVSIPKPCPEEVLVKVVATSVNPLDYQVRRGDYKPDTPLPCITGHDVSGVVVDTGKNVTNFKNGDEVYYTRQFFYGDGTYASYHVANERIVAVKPTNISHEEAAALPLVSGTAWEMLVTRANLQKGETILVHAGAGGVGSITIQLAKALGATVLTTARTDNFEMLTKLGADYLIDYRIEDYKKKVLEITGGNGVDIVIDTIGGQVLSESPLVLSPLGRVVSLVDISIPQNLIHAWGKNATYHFVFTRQNRAKLNYITEFVESGKVRSIVDSIFPIEEISDAHRRLEDFRPSRNLKGKIVITLDR
jgi:NADPH:quinone reductase-like Zn-dependent oxidoreductase